MNTNSFVGDWEVVTYGHINAPEIQSGLEGVRFRLDRTGDVIWTVSDELKSIPLFWCDTYEVDYSILRFGAYAGHVIEFNVEPCIPIDMMILRCEGWCIMQCNRIENEPPEKYMMLPFVLMKALDEGYFSDLTITASNNKKFEVHLCILQLLAPDILWESDPSPFTGIEEPVINTILHYLYMECLPSDEDKRTIEAVRDVSKNYPCLSKLVDMCEMYITNMALKQQINELMNDLHNSMDQIIDYFTAKNPNTSPDLVTNPAELCFVIKQSIRDIAVIAAKLLVLCDTFAKRKSVLTTDESNNIISYAKSRLPIFLLQLERLLQALKVTFNKMTVAQKRELAVYLVPEVASSLNLLVVITVDVESKLSEIVNCLFTEVKTNEKKLSAADVIGRSLKNVLHRREMVKLTDIHYQIKKNIQMFMNLKSGFNSYTTNQKITAISRNLDYLITELRFFLIRLDEFKIAFEEKFHWGEFKYSFKLLTSEVSGVLQQLVAHKSIVLNFIQDLCNKVQREAFTQCFRTLGLLDQEETSSSDLNSSLNLGLNLLESFCLPPPPTKSNLGKMAMQLFLNGTKTDMEFEVICSPVSELDDLEANQEEKVIIPAHRAIVASRCEWFKKALTSGMRETIEKKITIHDTNPNIFKIFLEYLYSGILKPSQLNNEQLAELLLLSDRYELDSLKVACEYALQSNIDNENVMSLLSIADQFTGKVLKKRCLSFISRNHQSIDRELYYELPNALQVEVLQIINSSKPRPDQMRVRTGLCFLQKGISSLRLNQSHSEESSDEEDLSLEGERLDVCIAQLRGIIGDTAPRDRLVHIVLAADFDLCRAINYFYSRDYEDE
ncbi:uncharacterized protein [Onthophagus taurus]|uniref:uncharacterized protein n=1 Tax=Onthophagus taurus TaxID=166361 RepID=UPI0039BDD9D8